MKTEFPVLSGEQFTFTHKGKTYRATIGQDDDMGAPWEENCGHCDVTRASSGYGSVYGDSKKPGELVLHRGDRNEYSYVADIPECIEKAMREQWGAPDTAVAKFAKKHGRQPTKREIAHLSVMADIEYLRGWCAGEWCWVYVAVVQIDDAGAEVGQTRCTHGIESSCGNYIKNDVFPGLAEECEGN